MLTPAVVLTKITDITVCHQQSVLTVKQFTKATHSASKQFRFQHAQHQEIAVVVKADHAAIALGTMASPVLSIVAVFDVLGQLLGGNAPRAFKVLLGSI